MDRHLQLCGGGSMPCRGTDKEDMGTASSGRIAARGRCELCLVGRGSCACPPCAWPWPVKHSPLPAGRCAFCCGWVPPRVVLAVVPFVCLESCPAAHFCVHTVSQQGGDCCCIVLSVGMSVAGQRRLLRTCERGCVCPCIEGRGHQRAKKAVRQCPSATASHPDGLRYGGATLIDPQVAGPGHILHNTHVRGVPGPRLALRDWRWKPCTYSSGVGRVIFDCRTVVRRREMAHPQ